MLLVACLFVGVWADWFCLVGGRFFFVCVFVVSQLFVCLFCWLWAVFVYFGCAVLVDCLFGCGFCVLC